MTFEEVKEILQLDCQVTFTDGELRSMLEFFHDNGVILMPSRGWR